jgi:hypothetical protein
MSGERYSTTRTRTGTVVQAGLDIRNRDNPSHRMRPMLGIYRALVVETFPPQLAGGIDNPESYRKFQVECNVILLKSQLFLRRVPVQQPSYSVNNAQPWVPQAATRVLSTGQPPNFHVRSSRGSFVAPASDFGDTDGDMVLVEFVEGLVDFPIITGSLTHEQSNRIVRAGNGWSEGGGSLQRGNPEADEQYLHHKGAEVRINGDGDVLIDTVGAYTDPITESPVTAAGQVRIRVKSTQRLTIAMGEDEDVLEVWKDGAQLRVDLGQGATERVVLGDAFRTFLNNWFSATYDTHTHTTGMGPSGPPAVLGSSMSDAVLSELAKTKKT